MKVSEIRQAFLNYFQGHRHEIVSSSSLVPAEDPTLLFTNAGMNQFKDVFLGREQRSYKRAVTSQKCVRAGGKHNDLENVGYTARHHTFFEMLGNFSFGDYFKEDAIAFAWEFLTAREHLALDPGRLWVTVYEEDTESYRIWNESIGVPADRIVRIGDNKGERYASDNFWTMGDTGPCGPCTEVFFDHGPEVAGGPPGSPEEDGDRYIEIWNVVFMQYNRQADGSMEALPRPSVDTGMGLERIAAVLQGVHSNYETDLFQSLLAACAQVIPGVETSHPSLRVIADHIRACAFLIADGITPSNEGRGFVLRRIIRRAVRHGNKLGAAAAFFNELVTPLVALMGEAYPELVRGQAQIQRILQQEEEQFARTLDKGLRLLEQDLASLQGTVIPGETVFVLYDTYGFPVDLTNDIARERGLTLDMPGYEAAMEAQRERARASSRFGVDYSAAAPDLESRFTGYEGISDEGLVLAMLVEGEAAETLEAGRSATIVLDRTPFYPESGGQVGDQGQLVAGDAIFLVEDTRRQGQAILHLGRLVTGQLRRGEKVRALVGGDVRQATALNHSATHLLHAALREVLGSHVVQKGSLVDAERLRFDFAHFEPVSPAQLEQIARRVNGQIRANTPVHTQLTDMETARKQGAMALFGEKYGEEVRVLSMGEERFSVELCGGTHVKHTGDIGSFVIISESGIAAGVRRIEALTGANAEAWIRRSEQCLSELAGALKCQREGLVAKVAGLLEQNRQLERELARVQRDAAARAGDDLAGQALTVAGVKVLAVQLDGLDRKAMLDTMDRLKNRLGRAVVVLAGVEDGRITLVAGVTKPESAQLRAGVLMALLAERVGGKGGGRPDMAQGGGQDVAALPAALESVAEWVRETLQQP